MKKKVGDIVTLAFEQGFSEGFDDGYEQAKAELLTYEDGVRAERDRVINMFKMLSETNMENGSASKAKQYYDAAALVKIADDMEELGEFVDRDEELYG